MAASSSDSLFNELWESVGEAWASWGPSPQSNGVGDDSRRDEQLDSSESELMAPNWRPVVKVSFNRLNGTELTDGHWFIFASSIADAAVGNVALNAAWYFGAKPAVRSTLLSGRSKKSQFTQSSSKESGVVVYKSAR